MSTSGETGAGSTTRFLGPIAHLWATVLATARAYVQRTSAYMIDVVRAPLHPLLFFITWRITYSISGRETVDGASASGYLLVGTFGLLIWQSTIWSSGYAIQSERSEGTIAALFLAPASRAAVVAGYGLGSLMRMLPSVVTILIVGVATGARLEVADPLALLGAVVVLLAASLATGFAFAGLFILSRRANVLANFLQLPIWVLSGLMVPRADLPALLHPLSNALPISHAIDALRASSLTGAGLGETAGSLLLGLALSTLYAAIGAVTLRRVEHAAKRSGQLDLY